LKNLKLGRQIAQK